MGKNHIRVVSSLPSTILSGYFDPGADLFRSEIRKYESLDELIDGHPDYCVIAAPTVAHEELAIELISHRIPVLIEKPVAHNMQAALSILEASKKWGVKCGIGHVERFNSAVIEAKSRIEAGELGEVYHISTSRQGPFPARISDVGVVKDLATHDIDLTIWLSGSKYVSVASQSVHRSGRPHEDMVSVAGSLANGVIVSHNVNWLSPRKVREITVIGERGLFLIDLLNADLTFYANGLHKNLYKEVAHFHGVSQGDVIRYSFDKNEPLLTEHLQFLSSLEGNPSDIVTLSEGVEILKIADAIIESSKTRESVAL
jgi:predicted dehydrogenase